MRVSVVVEKGRDKEKCEDAVLLSDSVVCDSTTEIKFELPTKICIADGVGGNLGGEFASHFVLTEITKIQEIQFEEDCIKRELLDINKKLLKYADGTDDKQQMATTLTGIFADELNMWYVQSGNTRLFIMQGSYLKQITKDHTTYQWLMECGQEEAANICNQNEIRCCFGGGSENYIKQLEVKKLDNWANITTMLMTSDGIHEYVNIDTLEELLLSGEKDIDIVRKMIALANENGSVDDKTAIIIRR